MLIFIWRIKNVLILLLWMLYDYPRYCHTGPTMQNNLKQALMQKHLKKKLVLNKLCRSKLCWMALLSWFIVWLVHCILFPLVIGAFITRSCHSCSNWLLNFAQQSFHWELSLGLSIHWCKKIIKLTSMN